MSKIKLYHYTRARVLASILSRQKLWFTDYRFLNDLQEFTWAQQIAVNTWKAINLDKYKKALQELETPKQATHVFEAFVDQLGKNLAQYAFSVNQYRAPYVFSLSADGDRSGRANLDRSISGSPA